jgi:uncharacterized protein (TIGR00299 family) protein
MPVLYYDCFAGISGDMNLGALIDLGVKPENLHRFLNKLGMPEFDLELHRDSRGGLWGTKVDVHVHEPAQRQHRNFREIRQLIRESRLPKDVKERSIHIFQRIAEAEGKIHGKSAEEIHFHEVGAVDSIVDIVGAAICLKELAVDTVYSTPPELGGGFVKCAHGTLPVPAPATLEILRGLPVKTGLVPFETTTPTGAAILAATVPAHRFTSKLSIKIHDIGYGIGNREMEIPNVLRVILGDQEDMVEQDGADNSRGIVRGTALMLECNLDDMSPEHYEYVADRLRDAGARDVFFTPTIMKKSRPAVILSVLCSEERAQDIKAVLFTHTTSLGIREYMVQRDMLSREIETCRTPYGIVRIKKAYFRGKLVRCKPEYEDCRNLAAKHGLSLQEIYAIVERSTGESVE